MLDRDKLMKLGLRVVEPTAEDERFATIHFVSKKAVQAARESLTTPVTKKAGPAN